MQLLSSRGGGGRRSCTASRRAAVAAPSAPSPRRDSWRGMRAGILVLGGTSAGLLLAYLAGRRHWRRRKPSPAALALLKTVDSAALEAELARRSVGAHVINTSVRPLHAARAAAIDAELSRLGVASPDALAPGPPRKAYETFARPREGEPCDEDYVRRKAPLMAQQVAFLHRHEQVRPQPPH